MKYLLIIFSLSTASCAVNCGMDTVTKSNRTIALQRQYGLKYNTPDTTIFVSEKSLMKTRVYQLWDVWVGDERYSVEYFAPTRKQKGFARVYNVTTVKGIEVDCEGVYWIENLMANKYPF